MHRWLSALTFGGQSLCVVDLPAAAGAAITRLPFVLRIFLENVLRRGDRAEGDAGRAAILDWLAEGQSNLEIAFHPGRIMMHDTTCGPALVDIAALRSAIAEIGGDPARLNPNLPIDVSTDHSLAVDHFGTRQALTRNMSREMERNAERYMLMKWAAQTLRGVRVHPPGTGIMHTINLEQLATVVTTEERAGRKWAIPDSLIGTDSHTPMVNGLGVLGWGVGGLEAEGVMFGLPLSLRLPEIIGVRLTGRLGEGVLATDLALTVTEHLRRLDLADKFVEFFGPGLPSLTAGERAVVANMAPEYGASTGYFPIDDQTCRYLAMTGRDPADIDLVERYARATGLWFDPAATPHYTDTIEIDLGKITTSLAGPRRPQDLLKASDTRRAMIGVNAGTGAPRKARRWPVAIAAITSCTNTSDPRLLIAAGLLARKARAVGLKPPAWVKTSLAPGSPAAARYLARAGVLDDLEFLGFNIVGYGCTTCIGNSGSLTSEMRAQLADPLCQPVAVLSGNRNFPGRVHPDISDAFLASPPMTIAFALAGDVDRDICADPIGVSAQGYKVTLADIWPSGAEIDACMMQSTAVADFAHAFAVAAKNSEWFALDTPTDALFPWSQDSTYLRRPPFASILSKKSPTRIVAAPLLVLGDDITTDHISPAGQIPPMSDAAQHLARQGVEVSELNVYASRRGNWEVMLRGLFTNSAVRNLLDQDIPAGFTVHGPSGEKLPLWCAAEKYAASNIPAIIIAGERYGAGSSRDWAAKGIKLLGVHVVMATSFERIHRSNLIGMGILPLRLPPDRHPRTLNISAQDRFEINVDLTILKPRQAVEIAIRRSSGASERFVALAAVQTVAEIDLLRAGGMLPLMLSRHT